MSQRFFRSSNNDWNLNSISSSSSSSSRRNSRASSTGKENSLKWSEQNYSVADIIKKFRLPQIVRLHTRGQPIHSNLPIPFNITQEYLLLFDSSNSRQLIAENLVDTSVPGENLDAYLEDVAIPEDYEGLFVQPVTTGNGTELVTYESIESVARHKVKGFLTMNTIQGIRKTSSLGSISPANAGSCPKLYPRGSIFLIEEVENWSFSSKGNLQNSHPSILKVPSANRKSTVHFADINQTNEYDIHGNIYAVPKRDPLTSSTPPPSSHIKRVQITDRLSSSVNEDLLSDRSLKAKSIFRSVSVGSLSKEISLVLKCKDASGRNVYFPFHTEGSFIEILTHPTNPNKLSIQVKELLNQKVLPPIICFVYGKKRLLLTSGFLKLKEVEEQQSVIACAVNNSSYVLFQMPVTSSMTFSLSLSKNLLKSTHFQKALHLCEENAMNFSRDIKVVTKLSSKTTKFGNGVSNNGLETLKKLEDIEEVSSSEDDEDKVREKEVFIEDVIYL